MRRIIAGIWALALLVVPVRAAPAADEIYDRLVSGAIVPGFDRLAAAARRHAADWTAYCAAPTEEGRSTLLASFNETADRWAAVEIYRTGPSAAAFRHERFDLWPDRKNAVSRGLAALKKETGDAPAKARQIAAASAAVQGLPALERLLYDKDEEAAQCRLGPAIAANAARLAAEMKDAWIAPPPRASEAARAALATDLVTSYAVIKDTKIEAVIGKAPDQVKPKAAEFWRSGRSLRDIALNLEGLALAAEIMAPRLPEDAALFSTTRQAARIAATTDGDLGSLAAGERRSDAVLLHDAVKAAGDRAAIEIPSAFAVTIGFNSLDGD
ncbi:MAG: imelysin family protein [Hyphomicrobiales bacterium]